MWTSLLIAVAAYVAFVVGIFIFQRRLMYYPRKMMASPSALGLEGMTELFLETPDRVRLQTWVQAAHSGFPTILYFHGNAYHLGERAAWFKGFVNAGFGLVAVSYRGFGKSVGNPSEAGIYIDARAAIDYAEGELKLPAQTLIYFGESLGTGVAVQMATERRPGLLVLQAPYTSVETRAAEIYPFVIGVRHLVHDKYNSMAKIGGIDAPILILHGAEDSVIPLRHGEALFAAANVPKTIMVYANTHHDDFTCIQITAPLKAAAVKYGLVVGGAPCGSSCT
jgi:fermentation-respiration switch protein FrsA (DUF1100 family)